ncbi:MAG: hypothetical protein BWZ04_02376 [Firmicutes bacterium ADurb.BinA205]|nr:MAG: hypothetical protein BWZ04_02376 [Firmicutes bacterium ADurb.BinA205]
MTLGEDVTNQELEKLLFPDRMVSKNVVYAVISAFLYDDSFDIGLPRNTPRQRELTIVV